jgi:hypothetical protein
VSTAGLLAASVIVVPLPVIATGVAAMLMPSVSFSPASTV